MRDVLRPRLRYLILAFTLFAAIAVGATGGALLKRFQSTIIEVIADKQAFVLQARAHVFSEEIAHLQVDMSRLARSAGVDLADDDIEPEKRAVALTATESAVLSISAAVLDRSGQVLWSEPSGVRLQANGAALVRQAIGQGRASISTAHEEIDVAAAINDRGAIVGIVRARGQDLLGERLAAVLRESGRVSLFRRARGGDDVIAASGQRVPAELRLDAEGQRWMEDGSGKRWLVTEHDITEGTNRIALRLVQSAQELERDVLGQFRSLVGIVTVALLLAMVGGALLAFAIGRLEDMQLELMKAQELAAMGKTSAAVAHEVKNSINGLSVALDLLASRRAAPDAAERVHAQAREEISRLRGVAEDLTLFSAPPQLERRAADLNSICRSAVGQAADLAADCGAEMELALAREPLWVHGDAHKLLGAIENLVRNGLEAMGPGAYGESLGSRPARRERRLVVASRREGRDAVVEVSDTGAGLTPQVRRRLFEPFVTTKRNGTGLGLAIVRRVVQAHGGRIAAEDRSGGGTVFRVHLPGAPSAPVGEAQDEEPADAVAAGTTTSARMTEP